MCTAAASSQPHVGACDRRVLGALTARQYPLQYRSAHHVAGGLLVVAPQVEIASNV
jgi:hypothetical protein